MKLNFAFKKHRLGLFIIFLSLSLYSLSFAENKLGSLNKPIIGEIAVLNAIPNADYFLREHLYKSVPFLVKNFERNSIKKFSALVEEDVLVRELGNFKGRVYDTMTKAVLPTEQQMTFDEFVKKAPSTELYWDQLFPKTHSIYTNISVPFCLWCDEVLKSKIEYNLLYTFWNVSSNFHHDGSENLFMQIKGTKRWLLANHNNSNNAYANDFILEPGLSPIDPDNVDLIKYPEVQKIQFHEVLTEPGDLLYIPEYWWHQVRSLGGINVGINLWLEYFNFNSKEFGIDDAKDVAGEAAYFAKQREKLLSPQCFFLKKSLLDTHYKYTDKCKILENCHHSLNTNNNIYIGADDGLFYALDSTNGNILWTYATNKDAGSTGILSRDGKYLYIAGENGIVYCFYSDTGEIVWNTKLGEGVGVTAALRLSREKIYSASLDGYIYCLSSANGEIIWKAGKFTGELWASPAMDNDGIIIAVLTDEDIARKSKLNPSTVFKLDKDTGNIIWEYATNGEIFASPSLDNVGNQVYVGDYSGYIYSLHKRTGKLLWKYDISQAVDSSPVIDEEGTLFVVVNGKVIAIDTSIRKSKWIQIMNNNAASISSPLVVPSLNQMYTAIGNVIYCLNREDGNVIWEFTTTDSFMSSPRIDKNYILYIGCNDNFIYALDAVNGTLKWKSKTNGPVVGSPVLTWDNLEHSYGALLYS